MAKRRYAADELTGAPPEPTGILSRAKSVGLSGLATIGNVLGTPGAMVKNAIAGKDPLQPLLHPISGEGRTEGRDILRQNGLIGKKNTWGNWAGGLAVDIALDPLTYLTGPLGAISKASKVGRAAGLLDDVANVATKVGRQSGRIGATETVGKYAGRARTTLHDLINHGDMASIAGRRAAAETAASKAGLNLDSILHEPLGGVLNVGLPFGPQHTIGAGKGGAEFLEGVGGLLKSVPGAKAVGAAAQAGKQVVKGLFHGPSGGRFDKYGQLISELAHGKQPVAKRQMVAKSLEMFDQFKKVDDDFHQAFRVDTTATNTASKFPYREGDLVQAADRGNYGYVQALDDEGAHVHFTEPGTGATATVKLPHGNLSLAKPSDLPDSMRAMHDPVTRVLDRIVRMTAESKGDVDFALQKFAKGQVIPEHLKAGIKQLADDLVQAKDEVWRQNLEMGGKGHILGEHDLMQHFPRYMAQRKTGPLDEFKQLPVGHASAMAREDSLRYLRADQIEDLRMNPKYRQPGALQHVLSDFKGSLGYPVEGGFQQPASHAAELVEYAKQASTDAITHQKRLFDNMTTQDWAKYMLAAHKRNASFKAIHEAFHMNLGQEGARLQDAFKFAGMDVEKAMQHFQRISGLDEAALASARIPSELANAAASVIKTYDNPEWANLVTKTLDTVNRYFKPGMVLVKPAFWFRNHTSGQYANLVSGYIESIPDFFSYQSAYKEAGNLWKQGDPAFMRELEVMGILGVDSTLDAHQHALAGATGAKHAAYPPNPLQVGQTSKEVWQHMSAKPAPTNPVLNAMGYATQGVRHKAQTWMETNAKFNRSVEYQNRASLYLYLKNTKGFTPEAAAKAVQEVHYDYSTAAMAPFERDVMRRIVPFYVFSRNNMPWTIERLLTHPGGGLSQTMQGLARAHKDEDLAPEYISETASVPMKTLPDGSRRFLTGVGLGFEDPAGFATPSLKQVGLEGLSRTTPIIKAPLEYLAGQSFFQKGPRGGRELGDLDPLVGRTLANVGNLTGLRKSNAPVRYPGSDLIEHILSNSPLSGVGTSVRTLTDPRKDIVSKAVNLGTGFKLSDVSPASMDKELRNRVAQIEKQMGGRTFTESYIPKELQAEMSPKERQQLQQLEALKKLLEARSKERKKSK